MTSLCPGNSPLTAFLAGFRTDIYYSFLQAPQLLVRGSRFPLGVGSPRTRAVCSVTLKRGPASAVGTGSGISIGSDAGDLWAGRRRYSFLGPGSTVSAASLGVGVCSLQDSRAAMVTMAGHIEVFSVQSFSLFLVECRLHSQPCCFPA